MQALREHRIGVGPCAGVSKRRLIVHPRVDDGLVGAAEPKEQPEPAEKFRATPMAIRRSEGIAKLKFRSVRIAWNFD